VLSPSLPSPAAVPTGHVASGSVDAAGTARDRMAGDRAANPGGPGGLRGPLGLAVPSDFHPLPVKLACDLTVVTYLLDPPG
jgi:hypothetical protein